MYLLDSPLEKSKMDSMYDMLQGEINRIFVSDDPVEIVSILGFAIDNLSMLAYSRIKECLK